MESLSVRDAAYFEQVSEGGKTKNAGYTIAWILGAIFILAILFWVFNRSSCNHNEMSYRTADQNCATRERLGILEGEMRSVGTVLSQVVPKLSSLGEFTAAQLGGLNEYTRCSEKDFNRVYASIGTLDAAVFAPRCGGERFAGGCGCGRNGGRHFRERQTFNLANTEVIVDDTCNV